MLLASGSPRRADLLTTLGIEPLISPADIDERPRPGETATQLVERLASEKAVAGWQAWSSAQEAPNDDASASTWWMVVAADTVVEIDGTILGKPEDRAEAKQMLLMLSGKAHRVHSGLAVGLAAGLESSIDPIKAVETTTVHMRTLDTDTIKWYIDTDEPLDKAGAYAIQGKASVLVDRIDGSFSNVVGLPVAVLDRLCRRLDWPLHRMTVTDPRTRAVR